MATPFDPYHRWLAIPPGQRPPTYHQLLGIAVTETDPEVIKEAALRQVNHVRTYQTGQHAALCTTLLNEIGLARATLLNPEKRRAYEAQLAPPAVLVPPPPLPAPELTISEPPPLALPPVEPQPRDSLHSQYQAGVPFWTAPALWVYVVLLVLVACLGFWSANREREAPLEQMPQQEEQKQPGGEA